MNPKVIQSTAPIVDDDRAREFRGSAAVGRLLRVCTSFGSWGPLRMDLRVDKNSFAGLLIVIAWLSVFRAGGFWLSLAVRRSGFNLSSQRD